MVVYGHSINCKQNCKIRGLNWLYAMCGLSRRQLYRLQLVQLRTKAHHRTASYFKNGSAHPSSLSSSPIKNVNSDGLAAVNCQGRAVRFSPEVHVILIPDTVDYEAAGLKEKMWWSQEDLRAFENSYHLFLDSVCDVPIRDRACDNTKETDCTQFIIEIPA